jgi:hypothetical protein
MLTLPRSVATSVAGLVPITSVVTGREDVLAGCPCVLNAVSSLAHGIVPAPLRSPRQAEEIVYSRAA